MSKVRGGGGGGRRRVPAPRRAPALRSPLPAHTPPPTDYSSLLQNDPAFMALKQQMSAQGAQDAAQRQAATQQALIQFGMIPDFTQAGNQLGLTPEQVRMLQGDITPQISGLAQANTKAGLSTEAQLQQEQHEAMLGLRNNLAARGGLSSGEDAYQTNQQNQSYARAQSQALQSLLAALGGYQQTYLGNQQNEQGQLSQGLQTAEANQASLLGSDVLPHTLPNMPHPHNGHHFGFGPRPPHFGPSPFFLTK